MGYDVSDYVQVNERIEILWEISRRKYTNRNTKHCRWCSNI